MPALLFNEKKNIGFFFTGHRLSSIFLYHSYSYRITVNEVSVIGQKKSELASLMLAAGHLICLLLGLDAGRRFTLPWGELRAQLLLCLTNLDQLKHFIHV